jgi:predicted nucleotide-binding protein
MNVDTVKVPVEYIITTTSDWTMFQIVEGGWWQDLRVEYKEGRDRLTHDITPNDKSIRIDKESDDETPVVVSAKCILNIKKEYRYSQLKYKILKGDRQSTIVMVTARRKPPVFFTNKGTIDGDSLNPRTYLSPAQDYLPDFKKDKVFIVHGRDTHQALRLNKFLNNRKVDAITFDDLEDKGKTIMEQIEYVQNNISYAFAILTPDDVGCLKEDIDKITAGIKASPKETLSKVLEQLQGRARQNVLFELGLFIGALGRENVCFLKQKNLKDIPSDLNGVLCKEFERNVDETFHEIRDELLGTE